MARQTTTIATLEDLLESREYDSYRFGSSFDDWTRDEERMQRVEDAASYGGDGSTHGEHIQDWRECLGDCFPDLDEATHDAIMTEINACEQWHIDNGSIDDVIG